jgi:hypothetical protein
LAKYNRPKAKIGKESAFHVDLDTHNGIRDGKKIRTMGRLRSFEHTSGSKPDERAMETGQTTWSNRKNGLVVHVPSG